MSLSVSHVTLTMATSGLEAVNVPDSIAEDDRKGEFEDMVGVPYAVIESDPGSPVTTGLHMSIIDVMSY